MTEPNALTGADHALQTIAILGGGTAGWMTAAALAQHLNGTGVSITLIESSEIGTIGVGEATIPTIRRFYAKLGMRDADVLNACGGTAKLGILFEDWHRQGERFFHPFGLYGQDHGTTAFHHLWLARRRAGDEAPLDAYSMAAAMARRHRMAMPRGDAQTPLSVYDWALHIDAARFAQHLRSYAEASGVRRIDAKLDRVERTGGGVAALHLNTGDRVAADLFVDCSGFRSLLLREAMGTEFQDWREWLPCDAAIAVQSDDVADDPPPYTRVRALAAGWQWRIPLRHRSGNGVVYSTRHWSQDEATATLLANLPGRALGEPRTIPFRSGRASQAWVGNVVAIGLAAGFLEPLESTAIALIETGIERLKELLPDRRMNAALASEFNDATAQEIERVRDFIVLHYKLTRRTDLSFWTECAAMSVPDTLSRKLALWDACGEFVRYPWEMFHPSSWLAILAGFDRRPHAIRRTVDAVDPARIDAALARMRASIATTVDAMPSHADFLAGMDAA